MPATTICWRRRLRLRSVVRKRRRIWLRGSGETFRPVEIQHPILGRVPLLQRWTGPGIQPQSGSGYTVKAVSRSHGPSERLTVDLSDLDQTR